MTDRPTTSLRTILDRLYKISLPTYWVCLFYVTHTPVPKLPVPVPSDKLLHFLAYALLAVLFWRFAEALRRPVSVYFAWKACAILTAYGALDEYLQSFVNRTADVVDWLADVAGVLVALALLEWQRRRLHRRPPTDSDDAKRLDSSTPKS